MAEEMEPIEFLAKRLIESMTRNTEGSDGGGDETESDEDHDQRVLIEQNKKIDKFIANADDEMIDRMSDHVYDLFKFCITVLKSGPPMFIFTIASDLLEKILGESIGSGLGFLNRSKQLKADGTMNVIDPLNGTDFKLAELQAYVGGKIDIVKVITERDKAKGQDSGIILVVNDEGAMNGSALNENASLLGDRRIYGDVVLCASSLVR